MQTCLPSTSPNSAATRLLAEWDAHGLPNCSPGFASFSFLFHNVFIQMSVLISLYGVLYIFRAGQEYLHGFRYPHPLLLYTCIGSANSLQEKIQNFGESLVLCTINCLLYERQEELSLKKTHQVIIHCSVQTEVKSIRFIRFLSLPFPLYVCC